MNRQMLTSNLPPSWKDRLKGAQFGFIAGILIGLIFGWVFHGIISLALRLGLLVVLLLPLIVIGWLWFRARGRPVTNVQMRTRAPEATWQPVIDVGPEPPPSRTRPQDPTLVDVPLVRPSTAATPEDIEAELEALKRRAERGT